MFVIFGHHPVYGYLNTVQHYDFGTAFLVWCKLTLCFAAQCTHGFILSYKQGSHRIWNLNFPVVESYGIRPRSWKVMENKSKMLLHFRPVYIFGLYIDHQTHFNLTPISNIHSVKQSGTDIKSGDGKSWKSHIKWSWKVTEKPALTVLCAPCVKLMELFVIQCFKGRFILLHKINYRISGYFNVTHSINSRFTYFCCKMHRIFRDLVF